MQQAQAIVTIEKRKELTYDDFFVNYLVPNKPVIITDLHSDFLCIKKWTLLTDNGMNYITLIIIIQMRVKYCIKSNPFNSQF